MKQVKKRQPQVSSSVKDITSKRPIVLEVAPDGPGQNTNSTATNSGGNLKVPSTPIKQGNKGSLRGLLDAAYSHHRAQGATKINKPFVMAVSSEDKLSDYVDNVVEQTTEFKNLELVINPDAK